MSYHFYIREAWVHTSECSYDEYDPAIHQILSYLFYGEDKDDTFVIPMGFTDLLRRVESFEHESGSAKIPQNQIVYFYNRQTIAQVFFRLPILHRNKNHPASIPLVRPMEPCTEIQMDSFFLDQNRILLVVDVTSRKILGAKYIRYNSDSAQKPKLQKKNAQAAWQYLEPYNDNIKYIRTDKGGEFGNEFQQQLHDYGLNPDIQFTRISKQGSLMGHPGPLAPVETAIRSAREFIEKYRVLLASNMNTQKALQHVVELYNHTKHSALHNGTFSPEEFVQAAEQNDPAIAELYYQTQQEARSARAKIKGNQLEIGEIVRLKNIKKAFDKQSYPSQTYSLYKVRHMDNSYVSLQTVQLPSSGFHGQTPDTLLCLGDIFPIHKDSIIRIKYDRLYDPPASTRYALHLKQLIREEKGGKLHNLEQNSLFHLEESIDPHTAPPPPPDIHTEISVPNPITYTEPRRSSRFLTVHRPNYKL